MANSFEDDAKRRANRARQVISGSDVRPPSQSPFSAQGSQRFISYQEESSMSGSQWIYLAILVILLALAVLLYLIFGGGVSSIFFFLLAMALFCGWFVF